MESGKTRFSPSTSFFIDVMGIVVIFYVLKELQQIFIPFVIAYFLFFVFSPLNNFLTKKKVPNYLVIIMDILVIIFLIGSISSVVVDSFQRLGEQIPIYETRLNNLIIHTAESWKIKNPSLLHFNLSEYLSKMDYSLLAGNVFSSTFSLLGYTAFVLFFFIFVVTGHENIYDVIKKRYLLSNHNTKKSSNIKESSELHNADKESEKENDGESFLQQTFQEITDQVQKYIIAKFVISLIMGIIVGVTLLAFGVDFPVVWAVLAFLFHFIPNIGSAIAVLLPSVLALVQFDSLGYALVIAVILIILQNIVGNILEPRFFGRTLGLNPLIILLSLLLWGYVWGIMGAILSVPLTAIAKIIISRSTSPNLQFLNDLMGKSNNQS
jgi:AI-2 transport protein TqsA